MLTECYVKWSIRVGGRIFVSKNNINCYNNKTYNVIFSCVSDLTKGSFINRDMLSVAAWRVISVSFRMFVTSLVESCYFFLNPFKLCSIIITEVV